MNSCPERAVRAIPFVVFVFVTACSTGVSNHGDESADVADIPADVSGDDATDADDDDITESDRGDTASGDSGTPDAGPEVADGDGPDETPDSAEIPEDAGPDIDPELDSDDDGVKDIVELQIGTDPHNPDSDSDGIDDGDEIADGTDPADPSDATVWRPDLNSHPRLFFSAADLPDLAGKLDSDNPGLDAVARRIHAIAAQTLPVPPESGFDIYVGRTRGQIAENAAFLALVNNDSDMLNKAVTAFVDGYADPKTADLAMNSNYDIIEAEALTAFCTAWDFLAGNPAIPLADLEAVRAALTTRIDDFRYMVHEGPLTLMMLSARNNHVIKVWAALGLCAVSLNDRRQAASDLSEAMTGIDYILNRIQLTPDGGVAEGFHYLSYGSDNYLPLFAAWHRLVDGAQIPFKVIASIQPDNPDADKIVNVVDFADNPVTRAAYRLALESATPSGVCPPVDDANGVGQNGAVLARLFDDPDFLWQWYMPAVGFDSSTMHPLTLAWYDGETPPEHPEAPLDFMKYAAGMTVMRESWEPDALFMHLSGEHGPIRVNGLGHEHPDELSFLVNAFGKPLIIDPGYINYTNHSLVFRPKDHNTVLVDGVGSPFDDMSELGIGVGTDAFLSCIDRQDDLTWTAVTTTYEGVQLQRRIVRVRQDFFIVEDRISAAASHEYTFLLNGAGGGTTPDSTFELTDDGAIWTNGGAAVRVMVLPLDGTAAITSAQEEHNSPQWGQWLMHDRLAVAATMPPENAGFLSIVMPAASKAELPEIIESSNEDGVAAVQLKLTDGTVYTMMSAAHDVPGPICVRGGCDGFEKGLVVVRLDPDQTIGPRIQIPAWLPTAESDPECAGTEQ